MPLSLPEGHLGDEGGARFAGGLGEIVETAGNAARERDIEAGIAVVEEHRIDVDEGDLAAARAVAHALDLGAARFERWWLDEARARLDALGGPFQATLCLNVYPYLFLGSGRSERHLADHDALFELLRELTGERLLFSARLSLADCPRNVRERAARLGLEAAYDEAAIRAAAERRFELTEAGRLGRIPLWVLDAR